MHFIIECRLNMPQFANDDWKRFTWYSDGRPTTYPTVVNARAEIWILKRKDRGIYDYRIVEVG